MPEIVVYCPAGEMINNVSFAARAGTFGHFAVPAFKKGI